MRITFDSSKRDRTLADRGLAFKDAAIVFAGPTVEFEDARRDCGETRIICFGYLADRLVVVGYTQRESDRHIFSMRKANAREEKRIAPLLQI